MDCSGFADNSDAVSELMGEKPNKRQRDKELDEE